MRTSSTAAILLATFVLVLSASATAQPADFNAFLLPELSTIDVGDTVFVRFEVDATAMEFNGYEVTIQYDPTIVDFLPPVIEGPLMTGACGNTFKSLTQTDSTLTYAHVILCAGVALNGPGLLSTYRFQGLANGVSPVTIISDPDRTFANAGIWISPGHPTFPRQVIFHNAEIRVGPQSGIDSGAVPPPTFHLGQNAPNPFRSLTTIPFELAADGEVTFEIFDVLGRRVWSDAWTLTAGTHTLRWDGVSSSASTLPNGVYLYRLTSATGSESRRLVLTR